MVEFKEFGKIARLNREVVITEKIDGTNAAVVVTDDGLVFAQSRNRVITPDKDNYGFARWVETNAENLKQLGPGYHYGEWWGNGIQRGYGQDRKRFSLFNTWRWKDAHPECCDVVPVLTGWNKIWDVPTAVQFLKDRGSQAAPGFMQPEGVIVWHVASSTYFKVTCENDQSPKGLESVVPNAEKPKGSKE